MNKYVGSVYRLSKTSHQHWHEHGRSHPGSGGNRSTVVAVTSPLGFLWLIGNILLVPLAQIAIPQRAVAAILQLVFSTGLILKKLLELIDWVELASHEQASGYSGLVQKWLSHT